MDYKRLSSQIARYFIGLFIFASCWNVGMSQDQRAPVISKCNCLANEVWDNSSCSSAETKVIVTHDLQTLQQSAMNTSDFLVQIKKGFKCDQNTTETELPATDFFLLPNGALMDYFMYYSYDQDNYCFDHIYKNNELSWIAKICVPLPVIPQCCETHSSLNINTGKCEKGNREFSNYSVFYGDSSIILNTNNFPTTYRQIDSCREGKLNLEIVKRKNNGNHLFLYSGDVILSWLSPYDQQSYALPSLKFCLSHISDDSHDFTIARFCYQDLCKTQNCVLKCCPTNQIFSLESHCNDVTKDVEELRSTYNRSFNNIPGIPTCDNNSFISVLRPNKQHSENYTLLDNGSLLVAGFKEHNLYDKMSFCIELMISEDTSIAEIAVACVPLAKVSCSWRNILYPVMMVISCVFLALTLCVYLGISEMRKKMHSLCLISEVFSLFALNITLFILIVDTRVTPACRAVGTFAHYFGLATFFWLNVMCFDLWSTLRSWRLVDADRKSRGKMRRKFAIYSVYGWGIPLIVTLVGFILDEQSGDPNQSFIAPGIKENCYIRPGDKAAYWIYIYGIPLVLLIINIGFFCHVAWILIKTHKETDRFSRDSEASSGFKNKERFWLYVKLFLVMGISWITDIISFPFYDYNCNYWILTDVINLMRGVLIFLIFICKSNTWNKVKEKYPIVNYIGQISSIGGGARECSIAAHEHTRTSHLSSTAFSIKKTSRESLSGHNSTMDHHASPSLHGDDVSMETIQKS